jgi:hypothetical protein
MKKLFSIVLLFGFLTASAQDPAAFDGKKWQAPYHLPTSEGWDIERFPIPASFAPSIAYKGVEDIRFTPGWAKSGSDEYWSYAFLWFLDGAQNFTSKIVETHLFAYYTGLFNANTDRTKIDTTKLVRVKATVQSKKAAPGDIKTFEGMVLMNDYMTRKPITLHLRVHIKSCEGQNKTFAFFELSPRPYTDKVWSSLDQLWVGFRCTE